MEAVEEGPALRTGTTALMRFEIQIPSVLAILGSKAFS